MRLADQYAPIRFVIPVLFCYGLLSAVGLHFHELFLDEAHHFLVSRDSRTLREMYDNLRYDGHPRLWGALLFFISHDITASPYGMQALQWLFAVLAAFILLRYSPFPRWTTVLMLAGYYFIFEYDLLSRNYAIGIWMLFLCCHLLRNAEKNAWWIGLLAVLMCSAHLFFAFATAGVLLFVLAEHFAERRAGRKGWARGRFAALILLISIGLILSAIQAKTPSADNVNMTPVHPAAWFSWQNISFAMNALVQGWLPVPQTGGGRFWNTCWLTAGHLGTVIPILLFVALLLFPGYALRRSRPSLFFYYGALGPLLLFFDMTQMTADRYFGMVFVFFLAAAWTTANGGGSARGGSLPWEKALEKGWRLAWSGILIVQVFVGGYAYVQDLRRPFSQSRNAAEYLGSMRPGQLPVVVDGYTAGPMLCAYLGKKLYYLSTGAPGSFCVWRKEYFPTPRQGIREELAERPVLRRLPGFILVSNRSLDTGIIAGLPDRYRLVPLKSFENSIVGEDYFIYRVARMADSRASPPINPAF